MDRFIFHSRKIVARLARRVLALFLAAAVVFLAQAPVLTAVEPLRDKISPVVRILLLKDVPEVMVNCGRYRIADPLTGKVLVADGRERDLVFKSTDRGLLMSDRLLAYNRIRFVPSTYAAITIRGKERRYRGEIDVIRIAPGRLLIINRLDLEDYIRGVLTREVSHRWPIEALRSQAVATRSYAVYQMGVNQNNEFDMTNDIYSQVYGGRNSERYRTNIAVRRTRGEVLTFQGQVLPAYFHATCAGFTEEVRELWKHDNLLPLRGVRCGFCRQSPHYSWKKVFRLGDIQAKLKAGGYETGLIQDIRVVERNKSGRIGKLEIVSADGKTLAVPGKDFRALLGPNELRNNNFTVRMKGYSAEFEGKGWGHGVGLCQWGAQGMASQGYDYRGILQYYYPGSAIQDYHSLSVQPRGQPAAPLESVESD